MFRVVSGCFLWCLLVSRCSRLCMVVPLFTTGWIVSSYFIVVSVLLFGSSCSGCVWLWSCLGVSCYFTLFPAVSGNVWWCLVVSGFVWKLFVVIDLFWLCLVVSGLAWGGGCLVVSGCFCLLLVGSGSFWLLLLVASVCFRLSLTVSGCLGLFFCCLWLCLAASRCVWSFPVVAVRVWLCSFMLGLVGFCCF